MRVSVTLGAQPGSSKHQLGAAGGDDIPDGKSLMDDHPPIWAINTDPCAVRVQSIQPFEPSGVGDPKYNATGVDRDGGSQGVPAGDDVAVDTAIEGSQLWSQVAQGADAGQLERIHGAKLNSRSQRRAARHSGGDVPERSDEAIGERVNGPWKVIWLGRKHDQRLPGADLKGGRIGSRLQNGLGAPGNRTCSEEREQPTMPCVNHGVCTVVGGA